ncbi:hypothetical protein [Streptosporangium vulgare]|uniref:hypothetical protein n=1 Tax=Streptosporangium vulgare TaxID=46190 RepID=UPI0031DF6D97
MKPFGKPAAVALAALLTLTACGGGGEAPPQRRPPAAAHDDLDLQRGPPEAVRRDRRRVQEDPPPRSARSSSTPSRSRTTHHPDHPDRRGQRPGPGLDPESSAPDFVSSGALAPLDDTLGKAQGYEFGDLTPSAVKLWQAEGKLYAYPFSHLAFGVFVNTRPAQEGGPEDPRRR